MVKISVIICTRNRVDFLVKAIESVGRQNFPKDNYEIIVVDNDSNDATSQFVLEKRTQVSNLRYIHEPVLGLNVARNTGFRESNGKYVAYLDDDGIANCNWLNNICRAFENVTPEPGCVGGRVEPIWESVPPAWLSDHLLVYLVHNPYSQPVVSFDRPVLIGVNMAFQRRLLDKVGGFVRHLDRQGKNLLSCGDLLVQQQIIEEGYGCCYDPEIVVEHYIPKSRLTKQWFLQRMYWEGISMIAMNLYLHPITKDQRVKASIHHFRYLCNLDSLSLLFGRRDSIPRFSDRCALYRKMGMIVGLLKFHSF